MRVSKEEAAENRERIVIAAAALMRERGISGAGVDALTEAAGLTHGSIYSQFGSKDVLAAEALRFALAKNSAIIARSARARRARPGRWWRGNHPLDLVVLSSGSVLIVPNACSTVRPNSCRPRRRPTPRENSYC
jgi:AcrR family transcriptional regulator